MELTTVGVLGCGTMGSGIAIVCANAGLRTVVREVTEGRLRSGLAAIEAFYAEGVRRGKTTADEARTRRERLTGTTDLAAFHECEVVVESRRDVVALISFWPLEAERRYRAGIWRG